MESATTARADPAPPRSTQTGAQQVARPTEATSGASTSARGGPAASSAVEAGPLAGSGSRGPASTASQSTSAAPAVETPEPPSSRVGAKREPDQTAASTPTPPERPAADAPLPVDTSPGGCATGECLPEPASPPRGRDDPTRALIDRWRAALDTMAAESPRHSASLKHARLLSLREGEVAIAFRGDAGFHRTTVSGQSGRPVVERLLSVHFGRPTRLVVDEAPAPAGGTKTLAELDAEARAEHERATGQSVRNHPAILATLRILGGELEHIQVLEHERTGAPGSDVVDEPP